MLYSHTYNWYVYTSYIVILDLKGKLVDSKPVSYLLSSNFIKLIFLMSLSMCDVRYEEKINRNKFFIV